MGRKRIQSFKRKRLNPGRASDSGTTERFTPPDCVLLCSEQGRAGAGVGTRPAVRALRRSTRSVQPGDQGAAGGCARASACPRSVRAGQPSAVRSKPRRVVALPTGSGAGVGTRSAVRALCGGSGRPGRGGWMRPSFGLSAVGAGRSALGGALEAPAGRGGADRLGRGRRHPAGGADLGRRLRATRARRVDAPELRLVRGRCGPVGPRRCARSPGGSWCCRQARARASAPGRRCGPCAAAQGDQGAAGGCARASACPRSVRAGRPSAVRSKPRRVVVLPTGSGAGVGTRSAVRALGGGSGRPGRGGWMRPSFGLFAVGAGRSALGGALEAPAGRGAADRLGRGRRHPVGGAGLGRRLRATRARREVAPELRLVRGRCGPVGPRRCARSPGGSWCCRQARARASAPGRRCGPCAAAQGDQGAAGGCARASACPRSVLSGRASAVRSKPRRVVVLPTGSGAGVGTRSAVRALCGGSGRPGRGGWMRPSFGLSAVGAGRSALGGALEAPAGRGAADRLGRGRRHPVGGAGLVRRLRAPGVGVRGCR
jgi:hypothetical protein